MQPALSQCGNVGRQRNAAAVASLRDSTGVTSGPMTNKYARPGRPPLNPHGSTPVNLRLPSHTYDELFQLARREHTSVPEIIRRALARDRRDDDGDDE